MIAKLKGLLDGSGEDWAVIDVGGVGYLLFCSNRTLARLPALGGAVQLFVETHVREDHIHLYGFLEPAEREWFRLLLTVQGVGSKVALAILSALAPDELVRALAAGDKAMLSRAQGVGPKLAARLASELKDRVATLSLGSEAGPLDSLRLREATAGPLEEAISGLVHLGYRRVEAHAAVLKVAEWLGKDASATALIGAGLKELGRDLVR